MQGAAETLRETEKYAWVRYGGGAKEYKEKKFLCVNGPLGGQRLSNGQLAEREQKRQGYRNANGGPHAGYCQFNNAGNAPESMIWVYFGVDMDEDDDGLEECPNCGERTYHPFRGYCDDCYYDEITGNPGVPQ